MFKIKYIICFIVLIYIFPCFSEVEKFSSINTKGTTHIFGMFINANGVYPDKGQEIRDVLYYLKEKGEQEIKQLSPYDNLSQEDRKEMINKRNHAIHKKWKVVLGDPEYNIYVQGIFQEEDFSLWMTQSPVPLFFAIQHRNIEMVKFFSKPKGIFE